jgi:hypothetical protein
MVRALIASSTHFSRVDAKTSKWDVHATHQTVQEPTSGKQRLKQREVPGETQRPNIVDSPTGVLEKGPDHPHAPKIEAGKY